MLIDAHVHLPVGEECNSLQQQKEQLLQELKQNQVSQYSDVMLVAEVARKYPELKLVCCHCFFPELEKCMHLMEFKNIIFDLSSVADDISNRVRNAEIMKRIIDLAPERVVFGSDFSCCSQKEHIEFIKELKLTKNIEDNIFWKNAKAIYSL